MSVNKKTTRNIASTSKSLSCKNLFKAQYLTVVKNNVIDHLKHPRKFILKDSQQKTEQKDVYFQFQKHPFKIQLHPFKWLDRQVLIKPTRYLTSKLLKNEYEPSMLLSFVLYTYFFIEVIAPVTLEPLMEQNASLYQKKEERFAIKNDYRYEAFNKMHLLLEELKKKKLKSKEEQELIIKAQRALAQFPTVYNSYTVYFSALLGYKNQLIENKPFIPTQTLTNIQNLWLKPDTKKTKDALQASQDIACSFCHLLPEEFFSLMIAETPHVFLDWAQYAEKTPDSSSESLKKLPQTNTFNQKDYLIKLLFRIHKKNLNQEIIFRHLYKNNYTLHDTVVWMNTSTGFKQLKDAFPKETEQLLNSSLYKKLQNLLVEKKITKQVFLKTMQEFIQWKFNLETWQSLGLQRIATYKKNGNIVETIITIKSLEKDIIRSLTR